MLPDGENVTDAELPIAVAYVKCAFSLYDVTQLNFFVLMQFRVEALGPILLQEQNSYAGVTNKLLARSARTISHKADQVCCRSSGSGSSGSRSSAKSTDIASP